MAWITYSSGTQPSQSERADFARSRLWWLIMEVCAHDVFEWGKPFIASQAPSTRNDLSKNGCFSRWNFTFHPPTNEAAKEENDLQRFPSWFSSVNYYILRTHPKATFRCCSKSLKAVIMHECAIEKRNNHCETKRKLNIIHIHWIGNWLMMITPWTWVLKAISHCYYSAPHSHSIAVIIALVTFYGFSSHIITQEWRITDFLSSSSHCAAISWKTCLVFFAHYWCTALEHWIACGMCFIIVSNPELPFQCLRLFSCCHFNNFIGFGDDIFVGVCHLYFTFNISSDSAPQLHTKNILEFSLAADLARLIYIIWTCSPKIEHNQILHAYHISQ